MLQNDINQIIKASDNQIVCYCANVSKGEILAAIKNGVQTFNELKEVTGVCPDNCDCKNKNPNKRCCSSEIKILIAHNTKDRELFQKIIK
ncbi:(2Fe-2S)-binding protein [Desulfovibrio litoralis]|uniref:BFD-like [2Fe-2S] binding domain-containing protein n=1 Tax=Desulfovibrio litoralis DSM 11393 TaxID=1121455 RepID=A0A1M7TRL7_9BACT|nr:(2Fe-2S)-binding protein [Desulfovibrio litoralis]SHN73361.1 BFD-like [2Fe-2S] binding domain-containing protein [Desulfovibrio litoralis DSM 11393]